MVKTEEKFKKLEKVVVNTGIGRLATQPNFDKVLPSVSKDFAMIAGQKPANRPAKKSISAFKLRQGLTIGLTSTLRRKQMNQFLERIIKIILPRVRDFRGISKKSVDARGNLSFGIKETSIFPEVSQEITKVPFGIQITVVPKRVKGKEEAMEIYKEIGIPFSKEKEGKK